MKNRNLIFGIIAVVAGVAAAYFLLNYRKTMVVKNAALEEAKIVEETLKETYTEVKASTTRRIVWEGTGFEPGFAFKIFSESEAGKEIITTNIVTQDEEIYSGFLTSTSTNIGTSYVSKMKDSNPAHKKAATTTINLLMKQEECTNPDDTKSPYTSQLSIGKKIYTGCAQKFN